MKFINVVVTTVTAAALLLSMQTRYASAASGQPARAQLLPLAGYPAQSQTVDLLVHLPLRNDSDARLLVRSLSTPGSAAYHRFLSAAEFSAHYGPLPSDLRATAATLRSAGFTISQIDSQFVYASAPVATVERYFGTKLGLVRDGRFVHIDARTQISLPPALARVNATVIGLNAGPSLHADHETLAQSRHAQPNALSSTGYFPGELLQAYGEPSYAVANGTGMHIAIVGLSDSTNADDQTAWCYYGMGPGGCPGRAVSGGPSVPYPVVNHIEFSGSIPPHTDDNSLEATLDAQMAGGSAPGAIIDQYAASAQSSNGFITAYDYIVQRGVDDIITTSYSECELDYVTGSAPMSTLQAYDDVFLEGTMRGQTFVFSSGDNGAYGCQYEGNTTNQATSAFASDPNVTGVGGTTSLQTTSSDSGTGTTYVGETSYSYSTGAGGWASGGGRSQLFATPSFQTAIGVWAGTTSHTYGHPYGTGRVVPDIAMHMGGPGPNQTHDTIYYGGDPTTGLAGMYGVVGTSASAPEFAGWLAGATTSVNAALGHSGGFRLGNVNNILYYEEATGHGPTLFHQMVPGDNFTAPYLPSVGGPYYNQVIGLGTPNWQAFYALLGLSSYQAAGNTFTNSNP